MSTRWVASGPGECTIFVHPYTCSEIIPLRHIPLFVRHSSVGSSPHYFIQYGSTFRDKPSVRASRFISTHSGWFEFVSRSAENPEGCRHSNMQTHIRLRLVGSTGEMLAGNMATVHALSPAQKTCASGALKLSGRMGKSDVVMTSHTVGYLMIAIFSIFSNC